jgi:DNA-binding NtrC family response regulator
VLLGEGPVLSLRDLGFGEADTPTERSGFEDGSKLPPLAPSGMDFPEFLTTIEKHYFDQALKLAKGNESKAAKLLGISRDTFRYRRKKMADSD